MTLAHPENWPDRTFNVGDAVLLPDGRRGVVKAINARNLKGYHVMTSQTQGGMWGGFELEPAAGVAPCPECGVVMENPFFHLKGCQLGQQGRAAALGVDGPRYQTVGESSDPSPMGTVEGKRGESSIRAMGDLKG